MDFYAAAVVVIAVVPNYNELFWWCYCSCSPPTHTPLTHSSQKESSKPLKILMILQIHSIFV